MFPGMSPHEYFCLQLRLEGKEIINDNQLRKIEIVADEEGMPLMMPRQIWQNNLGFYPYLKRSVFPTRMYNHLIRGVK
jgi:hypothetical protein